MKLRWILGLVVLTAAGCLLIPDDQQSGTRIANLRPSVKITAGAATSDSTGIDYKVFFQWLGTDDDGVVLRFEYAVDDTSTETAWQDTTGFSALLRFGATHQDVDLEDGTFTDWHTFYVRAVDNEYATSSLDHRFFNARTIAPTSRITFPSISSGAPSLVKTFVVSWEGEDIDSSTPQKEPAEYEYKMIRMESQYPADSVVIARLESDPNMLLDTLRAGDKTRWIRTSGETRERVLRDLQDTGSEVNVFALRAIDEAGATEPTLEKGENWIRFHVQERNSQPYVTVSERSVGGHDFPIEGPVWEIEVPTKTPIRFNWVGDASHYGSRPGNVNYGLDVPDPQDDRYRDPRGIGGWIGWGNWERLATPLIFPDSEDGQTHLFYLRMRDIGDSRNSERLCTILIHVVAFTFEKAALLVDDAVIGYGLTGEVQDGVHDAFIDRFIGRIHDFAPQGLDSRSMYRPRNQYPEGRNPTESQAVPLSDMSRYEALLWNFNFLNGRTTGIYFHERDPAPTSADRERRMLSSYVAAGGKLFLFGGRALAALMDTDGGGIEQFYPKHPPQESDLGLRDFSEETFIWKFLHVRNQVIGIDSYSCYSTPPTDHQTWRDGLVSCLSTNPAYPDLTLDPMKWDPERPADCSGNVHPPMGGIKDYEGVLFDRQFAPFYPEAGLDTLYVSEMYNWSGTPRTTWDGAVVAQRYEATAADTLEGLEQGRVILFMFQPYPFYEGPAADAGTAAINWLMTGQDY